MINVKLLCILVHIKKPWRESHRCVDRRDATEEREKEKYLHLLLKNGFSSV